MESNRFKFTKTAIANVTCPPGAASVRVYDTEVPHFVLKATPNGARVYYVYRKLNGLPWEYRIGRADEVTLDAARKIAAGLNNRVAAGEDPRAERKAKREGATLGDLWTAYRAQVQKRPKPKRPRSMEEDAGLWRRYLEPWQNRRLDEITFEAVQRLHDRIARGELTRHTVDSKGHKRPVRGGATAARLAVALLSGMFTACGQKHGVTINPARGVHRETPNARERYLNADELPLFLAAIEAQSEVIRDLVKIALFTAQRRRTLITMRWDEISLPFKAWTIPAEKMKRGKTHVVPLTTQAMEILQRRREADAKGEWVFASTESATGFLREPKKALRAACKAAGVEPIAMHDLRRTTSNWMDALGVPEATGDDILRTRKTVRRKNYHMAKMDLMRPALQKTCDAMLAAKTQAAASAA